MLSIFGLPRESCCITVREARSGTGRAPREVGIRGTFPPTSRIPSLPLPTFPLLLRMAARTLYAWADDHRPGMSLMLWHGQGHRDDSTLR